MFDYFMFVIMCMHTNAYGFYFLTGLIVCKEKASSLLSHVEEFGDASAIEYVKDLQFKLNKDCL